MSIVERFNKRTAQSTSTMIKALANYFNIDADDIEELSDNEFGIGHSVYMVLSDKEADKRVTEYIKDSVWAFRPEFIIDHSNLPDEAIEMVQSFQETKSDGANETILSLIIDIKDFVEDAIAADGRGHFLASDTNELEQDGLYIYKKN